MKTVVEMISPERAKEYLDRMRNNRPASESRVNEYAQAMLADQWMLTHQGIAFDDQNRLIDGQHRLMAVVRAAKTVRMMVTYDAPAAMFAKIDTGRLRGPGDLYVIAGGGKHNNLIVASARAMIFGMIEPGGGSRGNSAVIRERVVRVALRHKELLESLCELLRGKKPWAVAPVIGAFAKAALERGQKTQVLELACHVAQGVWSGVNDPFKRLLDRITRETSGKTRLGKVALYGLAASAIRASLEKRELLKIEGSIVDFTTPKGALD